MPPPHPKRRRTPIVLAILALLIFAGVAAGYLFTDIGRGARVEIPSVQNKTEATATALLEPNFDVRVRNDFDPVIEAGLAIGTDPPEHTRVAKGGQVFLIISAGPRAAFAPNLVGKMVEDATQELRRSKFEVKVEEVFDDKAKGTVIRQDPGPGAPLNEGDPVTLFVSKGPEPVDVPDLRLKDRAAAKALLTDAGLELGQVNTRATDKRPAGTVLSQDPVAGTSVPKGSAVDITVAVPATIAMPDVVGNTFTAARQKLQGLGFPDATSETVPNQEPDGTVIAQNPTAGTQVDPSRTPVNITVSSGPGTGPTEPGSTTTGQPLPSP